MTFSMCDLFTKGHRMPECCELSGMASVLVTLRRFSVSSSMGVGGGGRAAQNLTEVHSLFRKLVATSRPKPRAKTL